MVTRGYTDDNLASISTALQRTDTDRITDTDGITDLLQPCIPPPLDDGFRWTSKYLRSNPKVREIVDTVLELAYMPPHRALSVGKVYVSISSCPEGDAYLSNRYLVVKVTGALGWTFEFTVRLLTRHLATLKPCKM